jgi:hypothetical protein
MRRNWSSLRGPMGRAFIEGMTREDFDPTPAPARVDAPAAPTCDGSGDAGSRHVWADGSVVGDWCLCGKRKRLTPFPEDGAA